MSSNLVKGGYVIVTNEKAVTIDNNETIAKRLEELSLKTIQQHVSAAEEESFSEGFSEGIDPYQVARLVEEDGDDQDHRQMDARMQGDEVLKSARQEADRMQLEAQAQVDAILADARREKEAAYEEGKANGYQDGFSEGREAAEAQMQEELAKKEQSLERHYQELEEKLQADLLHLQEQLEPRLVEVLTNIYEHVLGIELKDKENLVLYLLKRTLQQMDQNSSIFIHVTKQDFPLIKAAKEELAGVAGIPQEKLELVENNTLAPGGCMIESDYGILDCGLDTQLALLKKQLRLLSYQDTEVGNENGEFK